VIPQLHTERLLLRELRESDFEAYAGMMADPDVARFLSNGPITRVDAWRSLASVIGHWALRGYGMWAVERKSDHMFVGRVGLWNPEGWVGLEVGWTLARGFWGNGYATEAARAAMSYGFLTHDVSRLISVINPLNHHSQRVAERLGETRTEQQEIEFHGEKIMVDVWSISREEWARKL
jgi:RimJ/RimL family protein N-acetyltransferase